MTKRTRNLYEILYWDYSFMDDETRWYTKRDFVETWSEEKAREIFEALHPVKQAYRPDGSPHAKWEIYSVHLLVEDV